MENELEALRQLRALNAEEIAWRKCAEQEIERLRGSLRGIIYKLSRDCTLTALSIAEEALKNSVRKYPYPIDGAPEDPTEVKV